MAMSAGEQQSRSDFVEILSSLGRKFDIILVKWSDDKDFEIRIRTEIDRDNDDFNGLCDEWVDLFSSATNTIWVKKISNTGPKIRFRKQYQCWTHGAGKIQKELLFDSRRCRGVLDMKVLTDTPLTRRKNKHIRMGLNAVVKINLSHLHPVNTLESYSFFVHSCAPQIDPMLPPPPPLHPHPTLLSLETLKPLEPLMHTPELVLCQPTHTLMFDAHTLTLQPATTHHHHHILQQQCGDGDLNQQQQQHHGYLH